MFEIKDTSVSAHLYKNESYADNLHIFGINTKI